MSSGFVCFLFVIVCHIYFLMGFGEVKAFELLIGNCPLWQNVNNHHLVLLSGNVVLFFFLHYVQFMTPHSLQCQ